MGGRVQVWVQAKKAPQRGRHAAEINDCKSMASEQEAQRFTDGPQVY